MTKKASLLLLIIFPLLLCSQNKKYEPIDGVKEISLIHNGLQRSCLIYNPPIVKRKPVPLLLVLHGAGATPGGLIKLTRYRFNRLADENNFIVAYPQGMGRTWHDDRNDKKSYAHKNNIDDVGFIEALIDRLASQYPVDSTRVFAAGISNGGFMCFRLACELSLKIRGIAVVAANLPVGQKNTCIPQRAMPVIIFNGTSDSIVPYNGGAVKLLGRTWGFILSSDDTARYWAKINNCSPDPQIEELPDISPNDHTHVKLLSFNSCNIGAEVHLYRIEGGGHTWPGGVQYLYPVFIGYTSHDINACNIIWDFFSRLR